MTTNKIQLKVGDRVVLNSKTEDWGEKGKVTKIRQDEDLEIDFDDGEVGCYRQSEVEVLALETHFGFAEYDGKQELYDGNFDATCSGSEAKVVGFLQNLRVKLDTREEGTQWRGRNGTFYSGQVASKAISAEVARIEGRE